MKNRERLVEAGYDDAIVFENPDYDAAIIGIDEEGGRVIYDYEKMVKCLMDEDGMTEEEATDFIDYNTIRALPYAGPTAPIVMYSLI